jgi:hypothetical protein
MWIKTLKSGLINSDRLIGMTTRRYESGSGAIVAVINDYRIITGIGTNLTTSDMAEYNNYETAEKVLNKIMYAIKQDKRVFVIPTEEELLKDDNKAESKPKTAEVTPKGNTGKVIELWNTLEGKGVKPVTRLSPTSDRHKMLMARIREFGMDNIEKAIENIKRSDYLCKQKWFTFDWFIRPNNFPKVLDGNYNDDNKDKLDSYWNE